ncbi:FBLI1 protein, partial [Centropus bengalensis]|nr:FBLI1 protein [Centropus bengalensis]
MLPGKAEKRIASSVFITLVPPRREVPTKEQSHREMLPDGAGDPGTRPPRTPHVIAPRVGRRLLLGQVTERCCTAGRALLGGYWMFLPPLNLPCWALAAGTHLAAPQPSSPPVLVLSKEPHPFSAETLGPALQQLDLAAPTMLQAPSTFPAELRPPKLCREHAGRLQCQDVNGHPERDGSRDICAFCHKAVGPREATVEAMKKLYHAPCFTCRTCQRLLAGQRYYQKDGRPTCDTCYQATLEKCSKCGGLITERIVRALGKCYHPGCFSCTTCGRAIGTESFAVDEQQEVYCVADFYRLGSVFSRRGGDKRGGAQVEATQGSGGVSSPGRRCRMPLSPEPTESGCYPLDNHLLCKSCHVHWRNESSC